MIIIIRHRPLEKTNKDISGVIRADIPHIYIVNILKSFPLSVSSFLLKALLVIIDLYINILGVCACTCV